MVRQNRKIQFIILLTLVCLVGTMSIAYAILATTLNITGTAQVMDASWNVHFDNINVSYGSVGNKTPTITTSTTISFEADLTTPGDFYEFSVDVVNDGTIDAMIESIEKLPELTTEQTKYLKYIVEYQNGEPLSTKQNISPKSLVKLKVRVEYRNDIPPSDLPSTPSDLNLTIKLVYVQSDNTSVPVFNNGEYPIITSGDGTQVGDVVKIVNEEFYVIENDGENIKMLAKYNLYVNGWYSTKTKVLTPYENPTGLQDPQMIGYTEDGVIRHGIVPYSDTAYWVDPNKSYTRYVYNENSNAYQYIENYKQYIEKQGVIVKEARLMQYSEISALGCGGGNCLNGPEWIYATTFYTGSARTDEFLWSTDTRGMFGSIAYYANSDGVRPVLVIPLSEF